MSLNLNGNVTGIYLGSAKADAVYLGNVKVFEAVPPRETVTIGGRAYPVATIGNQKWLAENLDLKASGITIGSSGVPTTSAAWYYNNDEATYGVNGNKYGLLYNWYAVKYLNDNKSTLFPGWHVPTNAEWSTLVTAIGGTSVGGKKLKSTYGWYEDKNGTDEFGFTGFPAGARNYSSGKFGFLNTDAYFWTASAVGSEDQAYRRGLNTGDSVSGSSNFGSKRGGYSIRLVKD